jgi:SAM-dependent methyltransferase
MMKYSWNEKISEVYQKVIQRLKELYNSKHPEWLNTRLSYSSLAKTVDQHGSVNVSNESPDSIAGQFYVYMPGHSFKVEYLIDHLKEDYTLPLHIDRAYLAVIDIGCGGATATTALINRLLREHKNKINIMFTGIDVSKHAIQLYDWMMQGYSNILAFDYHVIVKGMPEALTYLNEGLQQAKEKWSIPSLSDVWVIQSNVIRPLHKHWENDKKVAQEELKLDANKSVIPHSFGKVEAIAYEQLLRLSGADRMLVMTVSTDDDQWRDTSSEFGDTLIDTFKNRNHRTTRLYNPNEPTLPSQPLSLTYENPEGSYWRTKHKDYSGKFYADVEHIENQQFLADKDWQEIISLDNLRLAWIRVRAAMMREPIIDEVEIKAFEAQYENNLKIIQNRLLTYTVCLKNFPRFFYSIPKEEGKSRPRALQSIHEEILAVAIIQVIGRNTQELMNRNYGYRLDIARSTEYLYRSWFRSYGRFRDAIRRALRGGDGNWIVIRSDIANFYPSIPQKKLLDKILTKLRVEANPRIVWLMRQLLLRHENEEDAGVLQGPLASGFWANLFLVELDNKFSDDYTQASLFRYVDDLVLIVSDPSAQDKVLQDLRDCIEKLELSLSDDKTDIIPIDAALEEMKKDEILDDLDKRMRKLMDKLYSTSPEYQFKLNLVTEVDWWKFIYAYQGCLRKLGVFIEASRLSRKVWQYVQNPLLRRERQKEFPAFGDLENYELWAKRFSEKNSEWHNEYNAVKTKLSYLFLEKWDE